MIKKKLPLSKREEEEEEDEDVPASNVPNPIRRNFDY